MKNKKTIKKDRASWDKWEEENGIKDSPLNFTGKNHYQDKAYQKWLEYWQTTVDWAASPEGCDVWDAAVETIAEYVLCFDTLTPEELAEKIRTLKTE